MALYSETENGGCPAINAEIEDAEIISFHDELGFLIDRLRLERDGLELGKAIEAPLARISQCAVKGVLIPAGAKPARQLTVLFSGLAALTLAGVTDISAFLVSWLSYQGL